MSPFGPYADFNDCVAKNATKSTPEGFCAWLHHQVTGAWPSQMANPLPEKFMDKYADALSGGLGEKEAYRLAAEAARVDGWEMTRTGWVRQFQAPDMKTIKGVKVFAKGSWTDSAGVTREWEDKDLDKMVEAFTAGTPAVVPLKCGHTSDAFNRQIAEALGVPIDVITGEEGDGQIKLGSMSSLEHKGDLLIAAFDKVPEPIANLIEGGQYATVSVEIENTVGDFGPVITGVALLGAEEPAVDKATLDRALVFAKRDGAQVLSFVIGQDIPTDVLRAEFNDIRVKLAEIVKGKRGAPIFRALFGNLNTLFEQIVGKHSQPGIADISEQIRAYADSNYQGNIDALVRWAGSIGFDACVSSLTGKPGITDPVRVCGWLKGQAQSAPRKGGRSMLPKELEGMKADEIKAMSVKDLAKKFQEDGETELKAIFEAFQEGELAAIAAALGLGEDAMIEDIMAAIEALKTASTADAAAAAGGEMKAEFTKMGTEILKLKKNESVRSWEDKVRAFNNIPGKPGELAVQLAGIEEKVGVDVAETQFKAMENANKLAAEAQKTIGTSRTAPPTDFDNELAKFKKANPDVNAKQAYEAVAKEHPDLYAARK